MKNKKWIYMFSEKGAADYGYYTAKVDIDGKEQEIKYSAVYMSNESEVYKFKDKVKVGEFDPSQLRDIKEYEGKYSELRLLSLEKNKSPKNITEDIIQIYQDLLKKNGDSKILNKNNSEDTIELPNKKLNNNNFTPKIELLEIELPKKEYIIVPKKEYISVPKREFSKK